MTKYIIIGEYPVEAFESGEANIEDYRDDYKVLAVCNDMDELTKEYRKLEEGQYQDLRAYEVAEEINLDKLLHPDLPDYRKPSNFDMRITKDEAEALLEMDLFNDDQMGAIMCKEYGEDDNWVGLNSDDLDEGRLSDDYKTFEICFKYTTLDAIYNYIEDTYGTNDNYLCPMIEEFLNLDYHPLPVTTGDVLRMVELTSLTKLTELVIKIAKSELGRGTNRTDESSEDERVRP